MSERIFSKDNTKIKYACKLAQSSSFREREKKFLAEGLKLCPELAKGCQLKAVFYTDTALDKSPELKDLPGEHFFIEQYIADKLAQVDSNQGVFAVFEMPRCSWNNILEVVKSKGRNARFLALECVQDPGNVGTLIRSAAAFGFDAVLLSNGCASPWNPKTLRSSMGAVAQIPILEVGNMTKAVAELKSFGTAVLAAALYNSTPLGERTIVLQKGGLCVVIGSEGKGITTETVRECDYSVRIPITNRVESLNAGVAGSVLLWQFRGET